MSKKLEKMINDYENTPSDDEQSLTMKRFSLTNILKKRVEEKEITFDFNGHYPYFKTEKEKYERAVGSSLIIYPMEDITPEAFKTLEKSFLGEEVTPFPFLETGSLGCCQHCDKEHIVWFNGKKMWIEEECMDEAPFSVNIPIPSGKLIIANDLRKTFDRGGNNVNTFEGTKSETEDFALEHMFHPFVGNSCPSFAFKEENAESKNSLVFGSWPDFEYYDEEDFDETPNEYYMKNQLGSVCTDLWWVSAIDYDIMKARYEKFGNLKKFERIVQSADAVVEMKKGVYRCTSYYPSAKEGERDSPNYVYADMEWISEVEEGFKPTITPHRKTLKIDSIMEHSLIELLEESKYASQRPSLSTLLSNRFTHWFSRWDGKEKNIWFSDVEVEAVNSEGERDYLNYMEEVYKVKTFENLFIDNNFTRKIPLFTKKTFLKADPKSHFEYFHIRDMSTLSGWEGVCYPYEVSKYDLALNILFFYNAYINKNSPAIVDRDSNETDVNDFTEEFIFSLNMAYTNMIERGIKEDIIEIFEELEEPENYLKINGFSEGIKEEVYQNCLFNHSRNVILEGLPKSVAEERAREEIEEIFNID